MPGVWGAHVDGPQGSVECVDVEPGAPPGACVPGGESPAAAPLRELTGEELSDTAMFLPLISCVFGS